MQTGKSEDKSAQAPRGLGSEAEEREDKKREKAKEAAKQQRQAASGSISVHLVLTSRAPSTLTNAACHSSFA
jgi:hypothetical protein